MRFLITALIAGLTLSILPGKSSADWRLYNRGYYVTPAPYYYGPPVYTSNTFVSPYGYRSYSNSGIVPGPFGYNAVHSYGTSVRPVVTGPFHSIYWDPLSNTYRYTSGYTNTPNYSYYSAYPYPY